ncbi:unnamed protein product [Angiostrongylus costaricensis]|uniref:E3 ubiquitin-protein ligase E3D n=1 Tax=Angiostrongylus costaricensis TaxID=334426 RepID=A0A0R3PU23_ANGCS|nr:unnamed protein product [Angiostrongylus costaricensis]
MCSEWHARSFFLELKPRAELASLFVDCPPDDFSKCSQEAGDGNNKENGALDMIRVSEHSVELGIPLVAAESLRLEQKLTRYRASISDLTFYPQSLCASTWADNHRIFMCKLHVEAGGKPLDKGVSNDGVFLCKGCHTELGTVVKNCREIVLLHHSVCTLTVNAKSFLKTRFSDMSIFFAQLVLSSCEAQSSLKLVVRSLNKTPHLLIWLLDSYIVAAMGELRDEENEGPQRNLVFVMSVHEIRPFPAVKMLYKVFDAQSAASDPRANGEDSSVGLVNVPFGCCIQLIEHLLLSSHSLPVPCRSVGQFYVGFLKMAEFV